MSLWDVMVSMFWFMMLFAWIWLLITILADIFRDHEMSGWAKGGWTAFLIFVPWLGALTYVIVRGRSMNERAQAHAAQHHQQGLYPYVEDAESRGGAVGIADELIKLADLRDRGVISAADYEQAKAHVLGRTPAANSAPRGVPQAARTT